MYQTTDKFVEEFGQDVYEELFDALYRIIGDKNDTSEKYHFSNIFMRNAINYEAEGIMTLVDNKEICFHIEDGDSAGSVIIDYGEDIEPAKYFRTVRRLVLDKSKVHPNMLEHAKEMYHLEYDKIQEIESDYNYDSYVTGNAEKIRLHYKEKISNFRIPLMIDYETIEVSPD